MSVSIHARRNRNMKKWFQNLGRKMQTWMYGRYGFDELSQAMSVAALTCLVFSWIPNLQVLSFLGLVLWIGILVRGYSRNLAKRQRERTAYLRFTGKIKSWFSLKKRARKERKTHRYFKCSQCKKTLRVPKGKGKIKITCPHCHKEIVRNT